VGVLAGSPAVAQQSKADALLAALEAATRSDSNDAAAHFNLGLALFKARRYHDAEQPLRTPLMIDPQYAPALMLLARVNEAQNPPLVLAVGRGRILFMRQDPNANENTFSPTPRFPD
jgi:cytochrome c-type biogenesis protein CcmH/NrfG